MPHANFAHLHLHTEYSFLDGAIRIDNLVEVASRYRLPAIAITDHGNMCGAIEFYTKLIHAGIKPIIGEEVYVASKSRLNRDGKEINYHLVLLAKDEVGYRNLIKLSTIAHKEGFYYKPRIDKESLRAHSKGLIGMSACMRGEIAHHILADDYEKAKQSLLEYLEIFGRENFYLEIMRLGLKENEIVNGALFRLSEELGIPCVATNDCHYLDREDREAHDILLCLQTGKDIDDPNRMRFESDELYFRSPEEMKSLFIDHEETIRNTLEVAEKCNLNLDLERMTPQLPDYKVPEGFSSCNEYLLEIAKEGLKKRYKEIDENMKTRFEHEMEIIREMGVSGYFLIIYDLVNFAKRKNIPVGPGRGSCVGSLVLYSLGVTEIDPLKYNLIFERFLNPKRAAMPDVDIDFSDRRRDEIVPYIKNKYGERNVSQIITFGRMAARAVVRDVGRVLKIPLVEVDRIAKSIPFKATLKEVCEDGEFRKIIEEKGEYKKLLRMALRLEGVARHASVHAAGVVIAPEDITEFMPLYKMPDGSFVTQYPMESIEKLGLVKIDILGLRTLTIIDDTIELLRKEGTEIDIENIPLNDRKTYSLLSKGLTNGVFQLESSGMKDILKKIKPDTFSDIMAILALYRPGPLGGLTKDRFIKRKHKREPVDYIHKNLKPILEETYGVILYQEQVMQIASTVAGFSAAEADTLRRAMGKKMPEIMDEKRKAFIEGAIKNGYSEEVANGLFDQMLPFAGYGFNKSHSAAYSLISYITAYLKANYPVEFLSCMLTNESSSSDKVAEFIKEADSLKIPVYPPDVNKSEYEFLPEGEGIRFGLCAIKNAGEKACRSVISTRKEENFKSFLDFLSRIDSKIVTKRAVDSFVKAGVFDSMDKDRKALLGSFEDFQKRRGTPGQVSLFKATQVKRKPLSLAELLSYEKESLGFYLSGHPLDRYVDEVAAFTTANSSSLDALTSSSNITISGIIVKKKKKQSKRGMPFMIIELEDLEGIYEAITSDDSIKIPDKETPVIIKGSVGVYVDKKNVRIEKIIPISKVREELVRGVEITLNLVGMNEETLNKVKGLISESPGDKEVILRLEEDKNITMALCRELKIAPKRATISKLKKILGEKAVSLRGEI